MVLWLRKIENMITQEKIDRINYLARKSRERELTEEEIQGIDLLEQTYLDPDFIKG